ncbi:MAG: hypothetical protein ACYDEY_02980 [Acidimicrobiales bacterium]
MPREPGAPYGLPAVSVGDSASTRNPGPLGPGGFNEAEQLYGLGIGYVDAQLLAATRLTADARLWTADKRLAVVARRLRLLADLEVDR